MNTLSKKHPIEIFLLSESQFYFEIIDCKVSRIDELKELIFKEDEIYIQCKKRIKNNSSNKEFPISINDLITNKGIILNEENKYDYTIIELELINNTEIDIKIEFNIDSVKKTFSIDPFNDFRIHLNHNYNSKIMFSAPFGQGKTTFLEEFFKNEKEQAEYETFHLFPVNYSIAPNADIFEYIKVEILFQLLGKDVEFENNDLSHSLVLPAFVEDNIDTILLNFSKLIPNVGKDISLIISSIIKLKKSYIKYNEQLKIDDKEFAVKFTESFFNKEGSLYEDNYITQIIRQLIEQFYNKRKKTVLIIDDIDRLDPEHIFRILNVFSAHFDTPNQKALKISNKFGFDKIILVCDYNNLHKIFSHKFGLGTDFTGYIDKFFSSEVFHYQNNEVIKLKINNIFNNYKSQFLHVILTDMYNINELSLREIIKLEKANFNNLNIKTELRHTEIEQLKVLFGISRIIDIESLIYKIKKCKSTINDSNNFKYTRLANNCFIPLSQCSLDYSHDTIYEYTFLNKNISFNISRNSMYSPHEVKVIKIEEKGKEVNIDGYEYSSKDFYDLVLQIIEKYKKEFI